MLPIQTGETEILGTHLISRQEWRRKTTRGGFAAERQARALIMVAFVVQVRLFVATPGYVQVVLWSSPLPRESILQFSFLTLEAASFH